MCSPCRERSRLIRAAAAAGLVLVLAACEREARRFREAPPAVTADPLVRQTGL